MGDAPTSQLQNHGIRQPNYQQGKGNWFKKMEIFQGKNCFLFAYHHVAIIILQQLLSFVDLKNTHHHL